MLPARLSTTLVCRLPLLRRPSLARCRSHRRAYSALRQPRVLASAQQERVLFISLVWPERSSSAAGVRTSDLISGCRQWGWEVAYLSPAAHNEHTAQLEETGVRTLSCQMNREAEFTEALKLVQPTVCVFDRYYAEEAFSFMVCQHAPHAMRVLDMQDFHALRQGREQVAKDSGITLQQILDHRPSASSSGTLLRELAAIQRSDLTLVCSPVELRMLSQRYQTPPSKLCLAPFFVPPSETAKPGFRERQHFMAIGNWRHAPNMDSARWLHAELWDEIRQRLPAGCSAELHFYGAHATGAAQSLHAPARGIHYMGFAPSLRIMSSYRVLLAPLRFGAGLKGKIVDAWSHGLPVATTVIGAEGMSARDYQLPVAEESGGELQEPGSPAWAADSSEQFADIAASLYTDEAHWHLAQAHGTRTLADCFDSAVNMKLVQGALCARLHGLDDAREQDVVGQMLWSQQMRATEYFSRWIALKESI